MQQQQGHQMKQVTGTNKQNETINALVEITGSKTAPNATETVTSDETGDWHK